MSRPRTPIITPTIIAVRMDSWEGVLEGLGRVDGIMLCESEACALPGTVVVSLFLEYKVQALDFVTNTIVDSLYAGACLDEVMVVLITCLS
jgi:hypothetical protein